LIGAEDTSTGTGAASCRHTSRAARRSRRPVRRVRATVPRPRGTRCRPAGWCNGQCGRSRRRSAHPGAQQAGRSRGWPDDPPSRSHPAHGLLGAAQHRLSGPTGAHQLRLHRRRRPPAARPQAFLSAPHRHPEQATSTPKATAGQRVGIGTRMQARRPPPGRRRAGESGSAGNTSRASARPGPAAPPAPNASIALAFAFTPRRPVDEQQRIGLDDRGSRPSGTVLRVGLAATTPPPPKFRSGRPARAAPGQRQFPPAAITTQGVRQKILDRLWFCRTGFGSITCVLVLLQGGFR